MSGERATYQLGEPEDVQVILLVDENLPGLLLKLIPAGVEESIASKRQENEPRGSYLQRTPRMAQTKDAKASPSALCGERASERSDGLTGILRGCLPEVVPLEGTRTEVGRCAEEILGVARRHVVRLQKVEAQCQRWWKRSAAKDDGVNSHPGRGPRGTGSRP